MPDSIEECNYAALKIMMNRGRNADAAIQIFLDDSPITLHHDRISPVPGWYEIHFDKKRLEKKSSIHVYIRSSAKKYMHIWGDRDTSNASSTFHLQRTEDLSDEKGQQRGEYMIRLILRRTTHRRACRASFRFWAFRGRRDN